MKVKPNKYDKMFSDWIRERDGWTCQRCGAEYSPPTRALHCCHYKRRGIHATRFHQDNCVALCMGCHLLMDSAKEDMFKPFLIERLGQEKFDRLEELSKTIVKKRIAEEEVNNWLGESQNAN